MSINLRKSQDSTIHFQYSIKNLLDAVPDAEAFKSLATSSTNPLTNDPIVRLGVKIKELIDSEALLVLSIISQVDFTNLKSSGSLVEEILKYDPTKEAGSTKVYKSVDVCSYPPSLPSILNGKLLIQIMTDPSYNPQLNENNEKLAIKGRNVLNFILFDKITDAYPNLSESDIAKLRDKLTTPLLLSKFAYEYNLANDIRYKLEDESDVETKLEIISNVFLSYIFGLSMNGYSLDEIDKWIAKLYKPSITVEYDEFNPIEAFPLTELNCLFQKSATISDPTTSEINYNLKCVGENPYVAQVEINSEIICKESSTISLEDAKIKVAKTVLEKQELFEKIFSILSSNYSNTHEQEGRISTASSISDSKSPHSSNEKLLDSAESIFEDPIMMNKILQRIQKSPENQELCINNSGQTTDVASSMYQSSSIVYGSDVDLSSYVKAGLKSPLDLVVFDITSSPILSPNDGVPELYASVKNYNTNAKNELYAMLGVLHFTPLYQVQNIRNIFMVTVLIGEVNLGRGYDISKKIASQKAAMCALMNRNVLNKLGVNI